MNEYGDTTSSDYITEDETTTLVIDTEANIDEVNVEEITYGINKPYRIIISAKISHDQD